MATIQERGWAGHFCGAFDCLYRRNTLVRDGDRAIVVSSVGNYRPIQSGRYEPHERRPIEAIGVRRWYETAAFAAKPAGGVDGATLWESDFYRPVSLPAGLPWAVTGEEPPDVAWADTRTDAQHDAVVRYVAEHFDSLYTACFDEPGGGKAEGSAA